MVTEQEIKNRVFTVDFQSPEHSFLVTDSQMRGFDENRRKLASKINEYLLIFEKEHNYSRNRTYEELVDLCQQSGDTFKKIISGRIRATRTVLYKFCIGLELTLPQAEDTIPLRLFRQVGIHLPMKPAMIIFFSFLQIKSPATKN